MSRMWHTACCTSVSGEVVIYGGCTQSVLSEDPVINSVYKHHNYLHTLVTSCALLSQMLVTVTISGSTENRQGFQRSKICKLYTNDRVDTQHLRGSSSDGNLVSE